MTADTYCQQASVELFEQNQQADENFWQRPQTADMLDVRKRFIKRVMVQLLAASIFPLSL